MSDCCVPAATERVPLMRPPCSFYRSRERMRRMYNEEPRRVLVSTRGPRLIRTHRMTLWHRPKWAVMESGFRGQMHLRFSRWCSSTYADVDQFDRRGRPLLTADHIAIGETLCRVCEARAVEAGIPPTRVDPYVIVPLRLVA